MKKNIILNPPLLTYNGKVQKNYQINLDIDLGELKDVNTGGALDGYVISYNEADDTWDAGKVPHGGLPDDIVYYGDNISLLTNDAGYIDALGVPVDDVTIEYNDKDRLEVIKVYAASEITFEPDIPGDILSTNVQDAIEEVNAKISGGGDTVSKCFVVAMSIALG